MVACHSRSNFSIGWGMRPVSLMHWSDDAVKMHTFTQREMKDVEPCVSMRVRTCRDWEREEERERPAGVVLGTLPNHLQHRHHMRGTRRSDAHLAHHRHRHRRRRRRRRGGGWYFSSLVHLRTHAPTINRLSHRVMKALALSKLSKQNHR